MKRLILKNNLILFLVTLILALVFISTAFYYEKRDMHRFYLNNELQLVKQLYLNQGLNGLEGLDFNNHIQVINSEGNLLYDNTSHPLSQLPNQYQYLVHQPLRMGLDRVYFEPVNIFSDEISVAQQVSEDVIIRLTSSEFTMSRIINEAIFVSIISGIFMVFFLDLLTNYYTKKLVKPINEITFSQDYQDYPYVELQPLLNRLSNQSSKLDEQVSILASKENELSLITNHMAEGILLLDEFDHILMANPKAREVLGISSANINKDVYRIDHIMMIIDAINDKNSQKESNFEVNGRVYRLLKNPVYENEVYVGLALFIFDITDSALQESMRKEFSANVSHELKTPLTSISGYAELLKAGIVKEDDIHTFGTKIYDESQRLLELVNDILKLSNLENNDLMKKQKVSFKEILHQIQNSLHDKLERKGQSLSVHLDKTSFMGYQSVIHDIIYNITENACKYAKDNAHIQIDVLNKEQEVLIQISDDGPGIKQEDINRIFERFYRSDKSHSQNIEGTGLGLSIVKHSVLLHNGSIEVKNNDLGGATFTINLPKERELNDHA